MDSKQPARLKRELGVSGAVMMGLGSIVGTGVFVSIGIAAGITGPAVLLAIVLAGLVAMCNAFSSAQLAASHPVSGGTYEYGYRYLSPWWGFLAGWTFLLAKSASAATAALGFAGYLLHLLGADAGWLVPVAAGTSLALTAIVCSGLRRSNWVNIGIVTITLTTLAAFVLSGLPTGLQNGANHFQSFGLEVAESPVQSFLFATALMFVSYTGYGRIATLGEEVREPRTTIPRAIVITLMVSLVLYVAVAAVAIASVGVEVLSEATLGKSAPLEVVARTFQLPGIQGLVAMGAMTAMLGVLLNLILGLSRVLFAMGRRQDMPPITAQLDATESTPVVAVLVMGGVVTGLVCLGSVKTTWSFSAFTVLVYYAITNLAALYLAPEDRLYPRFFIWAGLVACLLLAFWVPWQVWAVGLLVIAVGGIWYAVALRLRSAQVDKD